MKFDAYQIIYTKVIIISCFMARHQSSTSRHAIQPWSQHRTGGAGRAKKQIDLEVCQISAFLEGVAHGVGFFDASPGNRKWP